MAVSEETLQADPSAVHGGRPAAMDASQRELLRRAFGEDFAILDGQTGELLAAVPGQPACNGGLLAELCREVARRGHADLIADEDPFLVLAVPFAWPDGSSRVAVGTFVSRLVGLDEDVSRAAELLDTRPGEAAVKARRQQPWSPEPLLRMGEFVRERWNESRRIETLEQEAESLSVHLASTYEEISLLYRLTHNLKISESDEDLGRVALEWLEEVLPAAGVAIQLVPVAQEADSLHHQARTEPVLLTFGDCPVDNDQFCALVKHLGPDAAKWPVVVNSQITSQPDWPAPEVRQMIVVSLAEGENLFGWLAAINHVEDGEFGTVEASLLSSVAAILGIHSGNIELYRQQSELLAGIVRALTSAIDAKDPYTCGHSDRVARLAVRLAEQLGCDAQTLDTIYLSGLLHDIGKIGIDDSVLRKPGKLSDAEYEHIKRHTEIGHKILSDIKKLDEVLPIVLHHHESWDGSGYPRQLSHDRIPLLARIVAVADAYDAMSSNRPYRQRMPDEKIEAIFRAGAGRQWDPQVIDALFGASDDIRQIAHGESQDNAYPLPPRR